MSVIWKGLSEDGPFLYQPNAKVSAMYFRPMPVLSGLAIAGLGVLIWLGSWQLNRYQEKRALSQDIPEATFVTLEGKALDVPIQYLYTTYNGETLWRVLVAVSGCLKGAEKATPCPTPYFVDTKLLGVLKPEDVVFEGDAMAFPAEDLIIRENSSYKPFGSPTRSDERSWFVSDATAMATALALDGAEHARILEPKMIDLVRVTPDQQAFTTRIENPFANPAKLDDLPSARHLGYALTWFGLAATLIGVYLAFHMSNGRLRFGRSKND